MTLTRVQRTRTSADYTEYVILYTTFQRFNSVSLIRDGSDSDSNEASNAKPDSHVGKGLSRKGKDPKSSVKVRQILNDRMGWWPHV